MATRAYAPPVEAVVKLPPVLAFVLGVQAAPRSAVEAVIEKMIAALDEMDGDPDLEDGDPDTSVEDDPQGFDPEEDMGAEDMREDARGGDVCDDTRPIADPQAYREHRHRLRRDRTFALSRPRCGLIGWEDRRLYVEPTVPTKRQLLRRKRGLPKAPRT